MFQVVFYCLLKFIANFTTRVSIIVYEMKSVITVLAFIASVSFFGIQNSLSIDSVFPYYIHRNIETKIFDNHSTK